MKRFLNGLKVSFLVCIITLAVMAIGYVVVFRIDAEHLENETIEANQETATMPVFTWWGKDVTDRMQVSGKVDETKVGVYELNYAWYTKKYTKTITVQDTLAPELVLEGDAESTISNFSKYIEPGFSASDICDGNLTKHVRRTVEETVENGKTLYHLKYSVEDSSGNRSEAERKVYVVSGQVYLTFDDGPSYSITPKILETLKKYNAKATFFLISFEGDKAKEKLVNQMIDDGHAVAIHGVSHEYREVYSSLDAVIQNFQGMQDQIFNTTGVKTNLVRFPGGSSNTVSRKYTKGVMTEAVKKLDELGYVYFDWNIDSNDAGGAKTADEVFENVTSAIRENRANVVLMHDSNGHYVTEEALERIIVWCIENGYELLPLDEQAYTAHHGLNN